MDIEEITSAEALEALAPAWGRLFRCRPDLSPFQSPAWLLAWVRAFSPSPLWTLAVWEGDALAGLAPFFLYTRPQDGRRQLTLLGNGISDRLDLLAAPGREAAVAAAVFAHLQRTDAWDACDWRDLPPGSALLTGPLDAARDAVENEAPCPVRALPDTPEAVVDTLPRKRRENLHRRSRRLAELGRVSFETADAASRAEALDALLHLHGNRWAARGEEGVLAEAAVRNFHEDATRGLLAEGLLRLQVLRLDGRVIAAHYGLGWGRLRLQLHPWLRAGAGSLWAERAAYRRSHGRRRARRRDPLRLPTRSRALQVRLGRGRCAPVPPSRGALTRQAAWTKCVSGGAPPAASRR